MTDLPEISGLPGAELPASPPAGLEPLPEEYVCPRISLPQRVLISAGTVAFCVLLCVLATLAAR
jgi:hypothetical protein